MLKKYWISAKLNVLNKGLRYLEKFARYTHAIMTWEVKLIANQIPDRNFYRQDFSPWIGYGEFADFMPLAKGTLSSQQKCYFLYALFLRTTPVLGDVVECGVYQGGTATMLAALTARCHHKKLHLFDTFCGIPVCNPEIDCHKMGDFSDAKLDDVRVRVGHESIVRYHVGAIPKTFVGLESTVFSFVHVDVDVYQSYVDCLEFFWPRLSAFGVMVFDDYGHIHCPGARKAVDNFFANRQEKPIVLHGGQAFVIKGW